jgi:hypothetical protein
MRTPSPKPFVFACAGTPGDAGDELSLLPEWKEKRVSIRKIDRTLMPDGDSDFRATTQGARGKRTATSPPPTRAQDSKAARGNPHPELAFEGGTAGRASRAANCLRSSFEKNCGVKDDGADVKYCSIKKCPNHGKCREMMVHDCFGGKNDKAEAAITALRAQRNSWCAEDQRDHLCGILGIDMDDQLSTPDSGSVFGMPCCDSHLMWAWSHSNNHFNQVTGGASVRKKKDGRSTKKVDPDRLTKFDMVKDWFKQMVQHLGCDSPKRDGSKFLHGFTLNGNLFPMMKANFIKNGIRHLIPKKSYYNQIWSRVYGSAEARAEHNTPYVRLRGDVTVSKCKECQRLDLEIQHAKPGPERRAKIIEKQHHLGFVYDQRAAYTAKRRSGVFGFAISCGTDATSSWFTQLPLAGAGTAAVRSWNRVDHKVTISVLHGCRGCHEYTARVCTPAWVQGGGNLQITIFFEAILKEIVDGWMATKPAGTKLPDTLFLQVDRGSDMFNRQWLAVLSWWLEEKKYFRKIVMSALPVGHSHDVRPLLYPVCVMEFLFLILLLRGTNCMGFSSNKICFWVQRITIDWALRLSTSS